MKKCFCYIGSSPGGLGSQGIYLYIHKLIHVRERKRPMAECWKQHAIENYHHQYYADMCSAILTCTSFSDNIILPGLKGQPHCVATKRVFNIAETHGFSIVSCHEKFCQLFLGQKTPFDIASSQKAWFNGKWVPNHHKV